MTGIALPNPTGFAIEQMDFFKARNQGNRIPIPANATQPPLRFHQPGQLPAGVNRRALGIHLDQTPAAEMLPLP